MINKAFSPTANSTGFHSATPAVNIVVQLNMKRAKVTAKYQYTKRYEWLIGRLTYEISVVVI